MRNSVIDRLGELASEDPSITLLVGDLGFGVVQNFQKKLPKQFINVGVAEQNLTGVATGLSLVGKKTITYSIGNFNTLRCLEQIRNDALYHNVNLTIISVGGGFSYGQLGYSHHATEDYGILRTLPNITIFTPGSREEAVIALEESLSLDSVCYIRIDKSHFFEKNDIFNPPKDSSPRELIIGDDTAIIGVGGVLSEGFEAIENYKDHKNIGLISLPKIKPLDTIFLSKILKKYKNIITIEEHNTMNGLSSIIKEICFDYDIILDNMFNLGIKDSFSPVVGDQKFLRRNNNIDVHSIIQCIESIK
jgi:transketolase